MFTIENKSNMPRILLVGIGGCGCNTSSMVGKAISAENLTVVNVNTDASALEKCMSGENLLIGERLTCGFGAGARPNVGLEAAQENTEQLSALFEQQDIVFVTTGLGGGTGTGAAPFIIELAKVAGKPVICVATLPFRSEGAIRMENAQDGLKQIRATANAVMSLPNDNILKALGESVGLFSAFNHADKVLEGTLSALIDLLSDTGYVNIDLNDFVTVMSQTGDAVLGVATTNDASAVEIAVQSAINNPIYETLNIGTAKGALIQINIREEISMGTYNQLVDALRMQLPADSLLVNGITHKPEQENLIEVFVIGTGITVQSSLQGTKPKLEKPVSLRTANVKLEVNKHLDKKIEQIEQIAEESQPTPNEYLHIPAFLRKQSKTE